MMSARFIAIAATLTVALAASACGTAVQPGANHPPVTTAVTQSSSSATTQPPAITVGGKPATLQQMADAVVALSGEVQALQSQVSTDQQSIQSLRVAATAIGNRAGCGYQDLGPGAPYCPAP